MAYSNRAVSRSVPASAYRSGSAPVSRQYAGGVYRGRPSSGRYPTRPVYRPPVAPIGGAQAASMGGLSAALGAIGGTLGCLLCLSAIAALGLFSCVVALTAYAKQFLDAFNNVYGLNNNNKGAGQAQLATILLIISTIYTLGCYFQRH